ncbi:MAG: hypothetical protein AAFU77_14775 [Myxococcota bacterium]
MADVRNTLEARLQPVLGHHTASTAVELACQKAGVDPLTLNAEKVPRLRNSLRLILTGFIGRNAAERMLSDIEAELGGGR